eukprot:g346.t1
MRKEEEEEGEACLMDEVKEEEEEEKEEKEEEPHFFRSEMSKTHEGGRGKTTTDEKKKKKTRRKKKTESLFFRFMQSRERTEEEEEEGEDVPTIPMTPSLTEGEEVDEKKREDRTTNRTTRNAGAVRASVPAKGEEEIHFWKERKRGSEIWRLEDIPLLLGEETGAVLVEAATEDAAEEERLDEKGKKIGRRMLNRTNGCLPLFPFNVMRNIISMYKGEKAWESFLVIGGCENWNKGPLLDRVIEWLPVEREWNSRFAKKIPGGGRYDFACARVGTQVFLIGGKEKSGAATRSVLCLDMFTGEWSFDVPSMSVPRFGTCAVTYDKKVYVFGGDTTKSVSSRNRPKRYLKSAEVFDGVSWKRIRPMREARLGCTAVVLRGKIYVVGGYNGKFLTSVEVYDPESGYWMRGPHSDLPRWDPQDDAIAAAVEEEEDEDEDLDAEGPLHRRCRRRRRRRRQSLACLSSLTREGVLSSDDVESGVIAARPPPRPRDRMNSTPAPVRWRFPISSRRRSRTPGVLPSQKSSNLCVRDDNHDDDDDHVEPFAPMLGARYGCGAAVVKDEKLLVFGGFRAEVLQTTELFDPIANEWTSVANMSSKRSGMAVLHHRGYVLVIGGSNGTDNLRCAEKFCPFRMAWMPSDVRLPGNRALFVAAPAP